ncbi:MULTISPECIES: TonB family protein [Acinetobacter]|uniref:TonB family protein n=1 Tax=Acinetobacter TaxID=469 RepID=UPI000D0007B0|nr:TonB family protein [Acinetobacter sp. MYb10]QLD63626.1 energy transducer TonB [Acinetobacter sp. MYb10]
MKILNIVLIALTFYLGSNVQAQEGQKITNNTMLVKWMRAPKVSFKNELLEGYDRNVVISFKTDASGKVEHAEVFKSSGLEELDHKVLRAVQISKLRVWNEREEKTNYPARAKQPFQFNVSREVRYKSEPMIFVKKSDLKGEDRSITIYAEADDNGKLTKAEITESSGLTKLDNYVLNEFREKASFLPLSINGKPYPLRKTKKFTFSLVSANEG